MTPTYFKATPVARHSDAGKILLIIDHREEIEGLGGEVVLFKVGGRTLQIVLGINAPADEKGNEIIGN